MSFLPKKQALIPVLVLNLFTLSNSFANPVTDSEPADLLAIEVVQPEQNPAVIPALPAPALNHKRLAVVTGLFVGAPAVLGYALTKGPVKHKIFNAVIDGLLVPTLFVAGMTSIDFPYEDYYDQEGPVSRGTTAAMNSLFNVLGI
jgi:hypothetical protein